MLHIVLLVLKIIGILILVILGLLLLLLLTALLVPLRYRISGSYYGQCKGSIKITWLLHIVSAVISYDGDTSLKVRVLGIPLYKPGKKLIDQPEPEIPKAKKNSSPGENEPKRSEVQSEQRSARDQKPETSPVPEEIEEHAVPEEIKEHAVPKEIKEHAIPEEIKERAAPEGPERTRKKPFQRLIRSWHVFIDLPARIRRLWKKIKRVYRGMIKKLKKVKFSVEELKAWICNAQNQEMLKMVYRHSKALIRHMLPGRIKGSVVFGFDDPYTTGQVLAYAGMLYPLYGKKVKLRPVFDRVIFEGEGTIKGRIRFGFILLRLLRAYRNKTLRALIRKWMG